MSPRGQQRGMRLVKHSRKSRRGKPRPPVFYRYVSSAEAAVIKGRHPQRVPNVDLAGRLKRVYLTTNLYRSAAAAEGALRIGARHPHGPFPSPTDRVRVDLIGITPVFVGQVTGGTGVEYYTQASPLVRSITP